MSNTVFIANIFIPNLTNVMGGRTIIKPVFAPNSEIARRMTEEHYKDIEIKKIEIQGAISYDKKTKKIRK